MRTGCNETIDPSVSDRFGACRPTPLKGMTEQHLPEYKYIYKEPGKYKVTFVATNANADQSRTVVREVEIEVEP